MGNKPGPKPKDRPKTSCLYYRALPGREAGTPLCTLTTYTRCRPETCPWYRSQAMADASYEKARQNYIKRYGVDEYYKMGYGPKKRFNPASEGGEA